MAEINPSSMAQQLATLYTQQTQSLLDTQSKTNQATATALNKLGSALRTFDSALKGLSLKPSLSAMSGGFSNAALGTASVGASALPGEYPMFVEQLATRHQIAFEDLPAVPVPVSPAGVLGLSLGGGTSFSVDLTLADADSNGTLSQSEIARAINTAGGNNGAVTALVMTVGGVSQLMLSSGNTGLAGEITLDTSSLGAGALKDSLDGVSRPIKELVAAQDAIVWMGAQGTGLKIEQSSNTLTAIDGVSITLAQAQEAGAAPATFTVAKDESATTANVKTFVEAYNALEKALDELSARGANGAAAGPMASDAGLRALRGRLSNLVHQEYGGMNLRHLGISLDRNGSLALDSAKLSATLAAKPDALNTVLGSASLSAPSGLFGDLSKTVDTWADTVKGQIKQRQEAVQGRQQATAKRQIRLDTQYEQAFQRYLKQFSALQALQSRFSDTSGLLASLPSFEAS